MKKTILIISLLLNVVGILLLVILLPKRQISCETTRKSAFSKIVPHESREVDFQDALKNIRNLVAEYNEKDVDGSVVRAYRISSLDMLQVMGLDTALIRECSYRYCRAYLGLDERKNFRLYLTPVENERDVFLNYDPSKKPSTQPDDKSFLLDLIAPCPKTCDYKSPLYTLSDTSSSFK